jgi:hypothetical protein
MPLPTLWARRYLHADLGMRIYSKLGCLTFLLAMAISSHAQIPCSTVTPVTPNVGLSIPPFLTPGGPNSNNWNVLYNTNFTCLDSYLSGNTGLPALKINAYEDILEIPTPRNPLPGYERWYGNLSTHQLSCITSSGAACAAFGGTVTSVGLLGTANQIAVSGTSPITNSGTFTLTLDPAGVYLPAASLTVNGGLDVSQNTLGLRTDCANGQALLWSTSTLTWNCTTVTVSGGANTALSNLATVAINASLIPGTDDAFDLGSLGFRWDDFWLTGVIGWTNGSGTANVGISSPSAGVINVGNGSQGDATGTIQAAKFVGTGSNASIVGLGQGTAQAALANIGGWMAPTTVPTGYWMVVPSAPVSGNGLLLLSSTTSQTGCTASATILCGSFMTPITIIASGTAALPSGSPITSSSCATAVTVSASGVVSTDSIKWSYNAAPTTVPGILIVSPYVTTNNVNFLLCNPNSTNQTPSATTINWEVLR